VSLSLAGLLGCLYAPPGTVWLWAVVLGLGQGGSFAVALTLIVLRSTDMHVAAQLSGMSQSVGYMLAAIGPLTVGLLHDWTSGWNAVGSLFIAISVATALFGIAAGRDRYVKVMSILPQ
jgi:CP family cyanate transporter-like MFS transporter